MKKYTEKYPIAVIVSRFNEEITIPLREGAVERLKEIGFSEAQIEVFEVPGAVEIPLVAQALAKQQKFCALIALGAVIRGETTHYDYVCTQVSLGCQRVMLDHSIPLIFGVLTTETVDQALDRVGGKHGHKGRDAADAAYEMVALLRKLA